MQFGTGAFLRGFIGDFVDEAQRAGRFDGRIVMIGQTASGRADALQEQGGLYTLGVQGLGPDGEPVRRYRIAGAASRALSARTDWHAVLRLAASPHLTCVVSNATEAALRTDASDRLDASPPASFPAKLTAFLYARARAFGFDPAAGLVVLPLELVEHNGAVVRGLVDELAERWRLDARFAEWLDAGCLFASTLVDRIVPGVPSGAEAAALAADLGYEDALLTLCEPTRFFAIEGPPDLPARLPWLDAEGVVVAERIRPYHERKVRILNGTHTALTPVALLCGLGTVREAMEDPDVHAFAERVALDEIVPALPADVPGGEAFARETLRRFANPFVQHELRAITLQHTAKMRVRLVPSITDVAARTGRAPQGLALGMAAGLAVVRPGLVDGLHADDARQRLLAYWAQVPAQPVEGALATFACRVLADTALWGLDLNTVPGFAEAVARYLTLLLSGTPRAALDLYRQAVTA